MENENENDLPLFSFTVSWYYLDEDGQAVEDDAHFEGELNITKPLQPQIKEKLHLDDDEVIISIKRIEHLDKWGRESDNSWWCKALKWAIRHDESLFNRAGATAVRS